MRLKTPQLLQVVFIDEREDEPWRRSGRAMAQVQQENGSITEDDAVTMNRGDS